MSRMEIKREKKKKKTYVKLVLMILFLLLISGILATDYALREMMALNEGDQLFAYSRDMNLHNFEILGDEYYIDQEQVYESLRGSLEWIRLKSDEIFQEIRGYVGK